MYLGLNRLGVNNRPKGAAGSSGPPVSSGKLLWLDASDAETLVLSGSNVTSWASKAGLNEVFTTNQGTPAIDSTSFALNSVRLGVATAVTSMTNATGVAITENSTVFMVMFWANVSRATMILALHKGTALNSIAGGTGRPWWGPNTAANGSAVGSAQQSGTVYKETTTGLQAKGTRGLWVWRTPDPNTNAVIRLNGVDRTLASGGSTDVPAGMVVNTIGCSDNNYISQGSLAELIVYNTALSTDDTEATEAYLKVKWGTP